MGVKINNKGILESITEELSKHKKVIAIYLFGSMAKGNTTPLSDIDICVIAKNVNYLEEGDIRSFASRKVDVSLFDDLPFALQWRILDEGKLLYVKDKNFIKELRSRTFKNYMDFKPIIKMQMEELIPGLEYA